MNVTTLDEQVAVFENAAAHLEPGGCFVVEVVVPQLRRLPPGETGPGLHDGGRSRRRRDLRRPVGQISWSHHWMDVDGRFVGHSAPYRYVWPAELDLMARLAGFRLARPMGGLVGRAFTAEQRRVRWRCSRRCADCPTRDSDAVASVRSVAAIVRFLLWADGEDDP